MNATGGFVGHKGDYSTGAAQVIMPHVLGTIEVYEQQTSWESVLENSDIIVLLVCKPTPQPCVLLGCPPTKKGLNISKIPSKWKTYYLYRPTKSETCQMLNAEWIPVNTATDVPLMLGIAHTLVEQGKHDKDFLKNIRRVTLNSRNIY